MKITANGKMYFDGIQGVILLKSDDDVINEIEEAGMDEVLNPGFLKLKEKGAYSFVLYGMIEEGEKLYNGVKSIKKVNFTIEDMI